MRQIIFNLDASDRMLIFNNFVVQGENLATELVFNLSPEFQGYKYLIKFQNNSKSPVITPELLAVENVVKYTLTNAVTANAGMLKIQFQAYDDNNKLIKSIIANLPVKESINGDAEIMPEAYVPWYLQAVEQANIATAKAEEAAQSAIRAADIMNKASVTLNHQFIDVTARDAYFTANPTELLANLFIKVGTGYQQYINGAWEDVSAIIVELQKAKDVPLEDTENKYVAENVEDALIEIHDDLETHKSAFVNHLIDPMPHQAKDLQNTKTFRFGLQMSVDGNPQIIFEEVI